MDYLLHPLNLVTFFPLLGVLGLLFLRSEQKNAARWIALITSLVTFIISLAVLAQFKAGNPGLQLVIDLPWIPVANWVIHYYLGVDGLSILLLLLTTLLTPISILSTWRAVTERVKDFMIFFLLLEVGMVGPVPPVQQFLDPEFPLTEEKRKWPFVCPVAGVGLHPQGVSRHVPSFAPRFALGAPFLRNGAEAGQDVPDEGLPLLQRGAQRAFVGDVAL